jgi:multidrug resistance efflux pump
LKSRAIIIGIVALTLLGAMKVTLARRRDPVSSEDELPLARVKRGELDLKVYTTGELSATHSMTLTAPPIGGGALRITSLVRTGMAVKKGDVVIEFDPVEQRYKLDQSRSELQQAEQDIIKAKTDAAVQGAQDKVELLKARFAVRRAELEVQKNELVSTIEATKNRLSLETAKRSLAQLEQDVKSHATSGKAGMDLAQEKWNKAKLAMDQAQDNIQKMRVTSPMDGLVAIQKNMDSTGGFFFSGASLPDYHVGDQAQPGSAVAQVIDPREMDLTAKVSELERSNINPGQPVEVEFDALPGKIFHGKVKSAASMVQRQFWDIDAGSKFDVSVQLTDPDPRLRPGVTAQVVIVGDKKANVFYIPRLALFQKDGKQIVYLKNSRSYDQRQIKVDFENESRAAISGLKEGDEVALMDPTAPRKSSASTSTAGVGGTP